MINIGDIKMGHNETIAIEDELMVSFCQKLPVSVESGRGVKVRDENGDEYIDFTSGWAVAGLGYSHKVITDAICSQAQKIIHNPNSGLTYAPTRAQLLLLLKQVLPEHLGKVFFTNSGAEANDAAIKLARKITGRKKVISALNSFHGRTIGTVSATGQTVQTNRFNVLMPYFEFVPYNDCEAIRNQLDEDTAAVILEPIQGEGGVYVPDPDYLEIVSGLCKKSGVMLIVDEIQTGFFRTGPSFITGEKGVHADFLTMGKGIAGGFPFGAVAVSAEVAQKIEHGDHGGTYNGNPLGCAVAAAVIKYMLDEYICINVNSVSKSTKKVLYGWKRKFPELIKEVRGDGLLLAIEFTKKEYAQAVYDLALENGLILNIKHGTIIRIFPALTITWKEMFEGLKILEKCIHTFQCSRANSDVGVLHLNNN
jgi:acetylornithine/N-succinyldiaminopimelate aminotransferase